MQIKKIELKTVLPYEQRYNTEGDWQIKDGVLTVTVSLSRNPIIDMSVAIHEIVEALLCVINNVSEESVDKWDMSHPELDEPGDHQEAPYHLEHMISCGVEQLFLDTMANLVERKMK